MKNSLAVFENFKIRRVYDEKPETWFFSVVDIIQALIQQPDYQAARNYWKVLKNRLNKEGSESVTKCNRLKMRAGNPQQADRLLERSRHQKRGRIRYIDQCHSSRMVGFDGKRS